MVLALWTLVTSVIVTSLVAGLTVGDKKESVHPLNGAVSNITSGHNPEEHVSNAKSDVDQRSDLGDLDLLPPRWGISLPAEVKERLISSILGTSTSKEFLNSDDDNKMLGQTMVIRFPEEAGSNKGNSLIQSTEEINIPTENIFKVLEKSADRLKQLQALQTAKTRGKESCSNVTGNSRNTLSYKSPSSASGPSGRASQNPDDVKEQIQTTYRKLSDDFKKLEELLKKQEEAERRAKEDTAQTVEGVNNIITIENVHTNRGNFTKVTLCKRRSIEVNHHLPIPDQRKKPPQKKKKQPCQLKNI